MDFFDFDNEDFSEINELIQQFEEAVSKNRLTFFDQDDFESIIDYYEDIGQFEKALIATEKALEIHPYSAVLVLRQAHLVFHLKDVDTALQLIEKALALDTSEIGAIILKAEIYSFQSKYNEALELLMDLEKTTENEDLMDVYLQICDVYEDMGKYHKVFEYLQKCLTLEPENDEAINRINYCVEITQNFEEVIEFFIELIDKHPYNYHAWYNLGCAYRGLGLTEKAIESFEFVLAINDDVDYAYIDLAELLIKENQTAKALDVLNDLSKVYEPDEEVFVLQGRCFDAQGNYKMARYYYKKALHQNPSLSDVYFKMGETYRKEELWEQAYQAFQKASDLEKEHYDFCLALAEAAMEIEEMEAAIEACETAIQIFVNKDEAYFLMAKIFSNLDDYETAERILLDGKNMCKDSIKLEYALVALCFLKKQIKEGERRLKTLCEEHKKDVSYLFRFRPSLEDDFFISAIID